jgi:hypothetical protein
MESRRRLDYTTDFPGFELEGGIFEFLLHISFAKEAEVSHLSRAAAIRFTHRELSKRRLPATDALLMTKYDTHGFLLCPRDIRLCET